MSWAVGLAFGAAALCVASPRARRVAWLLARGLGRALVAVVALAVLARRGRTAPAGARPGLADLASGGPVSGRQAWRVTLFTDHAGRAAVVGRSVLTGPVAPGRRGRGRRPAPLRGGVRTARDRAAVLPGRARPGQGPNCDHTGLGRPSLLGAARDGRACGRSGPGEMALELGVAAGPWGLGTSRHFKTNRRSGHK
jgi:hypothetical protein